MWASFTTKWAVNIDVRRNALFNVCVVDRTRHFGGDFGKLCIKPGDFGGDANTFGGLGCMCCGGTKAQGIQAFV